MTHSNEYLQALDKAVSDLKDKASRRDLLNAEIAGLRETVRVLSSRVEMSSERVREIAQLLAMVDYATPNLTDAIKALLTKLYPRELTAIEVRNALEESGFNFDDFSNSLSACHAALKRMSPDEVEAGNPKEGKNTYKRVLKQYKAITLSDLLLRHSSFYGGPLTTEPVSKRGEKSPVGEQIRKALGGEKKK